MGPCLGFRGFLAPFVVWLPWMGLVAPFVSHFLAIFPFSLPLLGLIPLWWGGPLIVLALLG